MGELKIDPSWSTLVEKVSQIVAKVSGNVLGAKQSFMVENRLKKRLLDLRLQGPDDYWEYFEGHREEETGFLISLLTTHHTFFFREFIQFEKLLELLPQIVEGARSEGRRKLSFWSAACSRGQEVYSLCMFLDHYLPSFDKDLSYEVWGSDIDPESVKVAMNGVYSKKEIQEIPLIFLKNHWAKGSGDISLFVKARESLAKNCHFFTANLLNLPSDFRTKKFDAIFCRNVFIYFEAEQVKSIASQLLSQLSGTGYFFSGVSESLNATKIPLESFGPSIYRFKSLEKTPSLEKGPKGKGPVIAPPKEKPKSSSLTISLPRPMRVLCVDDSKSILTLLKKILSDDSFTVVSTAENGQLAIDWLAKNTCDVITLDIHMPVLSGLDFLKKLPASGRPPVVMLSSASREDAEVALKSIELGASDFIEKPALNNLAVRGEEIKTKLKMAYLTKHLKPSLSKVDHDFEKKLVIHAPEEKRIFLFASLQQQKSWAPLLSQLIPSAPPMILFFEGHQNILPQLAREGEKKWGVKTLEWSPDQPLKANTLYLADTQKDLPLIQAKVGKFPTSAWIWGSPSPYVGESLLNCGDLQLLVEDLGQHTSSLKDVATDVLPATSFPYLTLQWLSEKG